MIGSDPRYQSIISAYRAGEFDAPYQAMNYTPSPYYNPIYDIRREQIEAGELEEGARFPKPLVDTKPKEEEQEEEQFDPCPPGYQLIDGVCQPDTMFQQGGDGGQRTEFESPYLGDIYTPMANDPINTELRRFAAQSEYQPTFGSSMQDLGRTLMQFSPVVGLLNAVGLGPSYTETVTPRFTGGGFNPFGTPRTYVADTTGMASGFNPFTNQMNQPAYQEAVVPETLAALDVSDPLMRAGASQPAVESVTRAMTNQAVQAAAQQAFKEAQQQDRGQSAGERAREAQRRSQSLKRDISTGSRIRGGI
jgi:hypothetical protein